MGKENAPSKRTIDKLPLGKLRKLLSEPVGSPISLTRDEAIAIVRAGIGGRPDLPSGKEYVRRVKRMWRGLLPRD